LNIPNLHDTALDIINLLKIALNVSQPSKEGRMGPLPVHPDSGLLVSAAACNHFCLSQTEISSSRLHRADTIGMKALPSVLAIELALELGVMYDFDKYPPVHLQQRFLILYHLLYRALHCL
jgi:hypothetical protein